MLHLELDKAEREFNLNRAAELRFEAIPETQVKRFLFIFIIETTR